MGIMVFLHPEINVLLAVSIIALQLLRESYTVLPLSTCIDTKSLHSSKALMPMKVTALGMVTEVRPSHSSKAISPIEVTLAGITVFLHPCINVLLAVSIIALQLFRESYFVFPLSTWIDSKLEQLEKEALPIYSTLAGMLMEVRLAISVKALSPMEVTLAGINVFLHPDIKVLLPVSIIALQLLRESYVELPSSTEIDSKELHPWKGFPKILVTLFGIIMELRSSQK
jgi:hypothetical protein